MLAGGELDSNLVEWCQKDSVYAAIKNWLKDASLKKPAYMVCAWIILRGSLCCHFCFSVLSSKMIPLVFPGGSQTLP